MKSGRIKHENFLMFLASVLAAAAGTAAPTAVE
jgi:hypothetical protein